MGELGDNRKQSGNTRLDMGDADSANTVEYRLRVRYAETDQMGVVHHANYLIWFEAARSAYCRARGIDYGQMERDGLILPLLEAHCRYLQPAFYEDEVVVRSEVVEIRRSLMRIRYEVRRESNLLATGETLQMLLDSASRKPRRFTPDLAERFSAIPTSQETMRQDKQDVQD